MIWGCRIFKLGADHDRETKNILFSVGSEYLYETKNDIPLKFYIKNVEGNELGKMVYVDFDHMITAYNREEGNFQVKISIPMQVQVYETNPEIANFTGLFANSLTVTNFRKALSTYTSNHFEYDNPLHEVKFYLKEKETELRKIFAGLQQVSVEGARDSYISNVTFRGNTLQDTPEYQKYVLDDALSGSVKFFGLNVNSRTIIVASDGTIYTRQGVRPADYLTVKAILMGLVACQAIHVK